MNSGNAIVAIDALKHFKVEVAKKTDAEDNIVKVSLVFVDLIKDRLQLIGECDMHIFEFISELQGTKTLDFKSKDQSVCECVIRKVCEFCFTPAVWSCTLQVHDQTCESNKSVPVVLPFSVFQNHPKFAGE